MSVPDPILDRWQRPLRNLRLSVTDRCNLRCGYCMPEQDYTWLPRQDILTFEEVDTLVGVFCDLGVDRVRLTGGEPLIRKDLAQLVGLLARRPALRDLAMTTNGILLRDHGPALRAAGLRRLTVSLDSLDRRRYAQLAGRDELERARDGIRCAAGLGFDALKLNTVVVRGGNDDELPALLRFASEVGAELRFIEYMDVGGATRWDPRMVVPRDEILAVVERHFGAVQPVPTADSAPARRFALADGTTFGVVASTTAPFCGSCDRSRITADGMWYRCLYGRDKIDLRARLRSGIDPAGLREFIATVWAGRMDRGAEDRLALAGRGALAAPAELAADPHLEMHTRGG